MKILVHLVSGQNLPNYIASKIIGADKELLVYTRDSIPQLKILSEIIKETLEPVEIPAWDYDQIHSLLKAVINQYPKDEIILNFTGGSKIMSLASFSAFKELKRDSIYINSEKDEYLYFDNSKNKTKVERRSISFKARLTDYLKLNGQKVVFENHSITQAQKKLASLFKTNFKDYSDKILSVSRKHKTKSNCNVSVVEGKLKSSLIKYDGEKTTIKLVLGEKENFNESEKGIKLLEFCFGKWFEQICFYAIKETKVFDEVRLNCHIQKSAKKEGDRYTDKNELDILAIKGIYPAIFECKSGGIKAEHIEKLLALKQTYLGRYSSIFFVTYFPLNKDDEAHSILKEKMNENKIIHLTVNQLTKDVLASYLVKKENLR